MASTPRTEPKVQTELLRNIQANTVDIQTDTGAIGTDEGFLEAV